MSHGPPKRSASKEDVPKQKCVAQTTIQRNLKQDRGKESTTAGTHNIPAVTDAIIISGLKTYNRGEIGKAKSLEEKFHQLWNKMAKDIYNNKVTTSKL